MTKGLSQSARKSFSAPRPPANFHGLGLRETFAPSWGQRSGAFAMFSARGSKLTFSMRVLMRDLVDLPFITGVVYLKWNLHKVETTAKKEGFTRRGCLLVV